MAHNSVASNLLMAVLVIGGLVFASRVKQEVFPEFTLDMITIAVPYPGASPEEVEQGIVLIIEEAVQGLDGIKTVRSRAAENAGVISLELLTDADHDRVLSDVKAAVDRIVNLPQDAERPVVSLAAIRRHVISLVIYGEQSEETLRLLADRARDELRQDPRITQVELSGIRPREIGIEVPQSLLRSHHITLDAIADRVRRGSVELPGGAVKTRGGELLLRTAERRDRGEEFGALTLKASTDGAALSVDDVAKVDDAFQDVDTSATFNGLPAVQVDVFRVGDQTPIEVAAAVREYVDEASHRLPKGVSFATWNDMSELYSDRVSLLKRNAILGLVLVFLSLGLFLELRLAFWVMLGIPISVLGAFLLMPSLDVSLNMISLFAFIVTLGIVVDDAIVVGENIYENRQRGMPFLHAAVEGVREVAMPVVFAVLTTVAAFAPLFFVPGVSGKFFRNIPAIVIAVLLISLIECLFVLPAHLAHSRPSSETGVMGAINRQQQRFSRLVERFIKQVYGPVLRLALRQRYLTLAIGLATLALIFGVVAGGHINFNFMPKIEADRVIAEARLPFGSAVQDTERVREQLLEAAKEVIAEHGGDHISRGVFAQVGEGINVRLVGGGSQTGSHITDVAMHLVPSDRREVTAGVLAKAWREKTANIAGLDTLKFSFSTGAGGGDPIDILLSHPEVAVLQDTAARLGAALAEYAGVKDIDPGFSLGKPQIDLHLKPAGRAAGLTESDLARQVRSAFFGAEAVRQQRGGDEVRVMVRLPEADRRTEAGLEGLILQTPGGGEIPLKEAASLRRGRAYTEIQREEGQRVLHVTADVEMGVANPGKILARVKAEVLPQLERDTPGLRFSMEGQQRNQKESMQSLGVGFALALLCIFTLLAVPLRSYLQPFIIMSAIPFGLVGAVTGHLIMGYDLSLISMMGLVALSGIVVNDSLILIVQVNTNRGTGEEPFEAVLNAGLRRFRPILLTSLTTFFGLLPMISETSVQARFLVPMAISLGWGVIFSTVIVLVLVPCLYLVLEDARRLLRINGSGDVEQMTIEST